MDYESFIITFFTSSEANLIVILANDDIAKNNEEEIFCFFIKNLDLPWGKTKVQLVNPHPYEKKEKGFNIFLKKNSLT